MLMEVYYEHYKENCRGRYWEEPKSLPYAVQIRSEDERRAFGAILDSDGLRCCNGIMGCNVLLINLDLLRWANIEKACHHSCLENRVFTKQEFLWEVYDAWRKNQGLPPRSC